MDFQFVTHQLAVGEAILTPQNMRILSLAGITHVVNMQSEFDDHAIADGTGIRILSNGCEDDFLPKPYTLFHKGVEFTREALKNPNAKVYFHCAAGIHRAPMMLYAVLRVLGFGPRDSVNLIQDARPFANFPPIYVWSAEAFLAEYAPMTAATGR
jgi:protein-tyrosine phosphatase